jgi:hypothetical protein
MQTLHRFCLSTPRSWSHQASICQSLSAYVSSPWEKWIDGGGGDVGNGGGDDGGGGGDVGNEQRELDVGNEHHDAQALDRLQLHQYLELELRFAS